MLEGPAIDHHLARLIRRALYGGGKRHLIARPGHVEVGDILDAERDADQHFWTLQTHPVDGIAYRLAEEIRPACRMWRLSAANAERVRQCQGPAKSTTVTIAPLAGHVSTVVVCDLLRSPALAVFDRSLRSLCRIARFARCDVRRGAAVFVRSDETTALENQLCLDSFRRLLLQIGGANIAARIALGSRLLRRHSGTKSVSPRFSSARRRAIRTRQRFPRSNPPPE
jgi:hypothetical protein